LDVHDAVVTLSLIAISVQQWWAKCPAAIDRECWQHGTPMYLDVLQGCVIDIALQPFLQ